MNEHEKFFELLGNYKFLEPYWDREKGECRMDSLKRAMGLFSSGEATIAKAVWSIWSGGGHEISFVDLAVLDNRSRKPLVEWLCRPFFP